LVVVVVEEERRWWWGSRRADVGRTRHNVEEERVRRPETTIVLLAAGVKGRPTKAVVY
jgi:hypothetical protein